MTIPAPFVSEFPLHPIPFKSRIQDQMDLTKNYFAVAFKPGFPLQAAELNELQEIFYVQQTLTQTLFANWHQNAYLSQSGTSMTGTPWNGCTPLSAGLVTSATANNLKSITVNPGWYLLKQTDVNGGFGVWVYSTATTVVLSGYNNTTTVKDGDYGIIISQATVNCTTSNPAGTNEDRTLQDASNINVINGPCGAARLQLQVVGFGKSGTQTTGQTFLPIFNATSGIVKYKNNYTIT